MLLQIILPLQSAIFLEVFHILKNIPVESTFSKTKDVI